MSILIKTVRISGFRGLENIEVPLEQTTILTGMNNAGKTSFLMALKLALGSRQFITSDDFFIRGDSISDKIIIDLLIVPIGNNGKQCADFPEEWEILFTIDRIQINDEGNSFVPLRTVITFETIKNSYKINILFYKNGLNSIMKALIGLMLVTAKRQISILMKFPFFI
jgi:putative ATP-dependent endonuclease of OLD family